MMNFAGGSLTALLPVTLLPVAAAAADQSCKLDLTQELMPSQPTSSFGTTVCSSPVTVFLSKTCKGASPLLLLLLLLIAAASVFLRIVMASAYGPELAASSINCMKLFRGNQCTNRRSSLITCVQQPSAVDQHQHQQTAP
jgi:hypothetical protein